MAHCCTSGIDGLVVGLDDTCQLKAMYLGTGPRYFVHAGADLPM